MATEATQGTVEFLGMDEAEAPDVIWSGHANDESVLVLVKWQEELGDYRVYWFVAREWQRVDGTARQRMFEYVPDRSFGAAFDRITDEEAAIAAAKAALTEHCGEEWS